MRKGALVAWVAVGVAAAPASAAKGPETVTDRQLGLTFQLPSTWKVASVGSTIAAYAPGNVAFLRVQDAKTSMSLAAIGTGFADSELADLRKTDPKATVAVKSETVGVGPAVKVTMHYRGTWVNHKTAITRVIYFVKNKNRAYEFDFGAAEQASTQSKTFTTAIKSVRYL